MQAGTGAQIIHDDADIRVIHQPGTSAFSLVTFGGLSDRPRGTWFWGQEPAAKLGLDAIGVLGKTTNWYPSRALQAAAPAILARLRPTRIGYGFSMGGYAALKYGRLLGLTHALALSPQTSIDPDDLPDEPSYHAHFDAALHPGMRVLAADLAPLTMLVLDPYEAADIRQASLIRAAAGVHVLHLPFMFHSTAGHFAGSRMLQQTLDLLLARNPAGLRALMRRQRAVSPNWFRLVGRAAFIRGHRRMAEAFWDRAVALGATPGKMLAQRVDALHQRAALLLDRMRPGDAEAAEALAGEVAGLDIEDPAALLRLAALLSRHGRDAPAVPLLRQAIRDAAGDAHGHLALIHALRKLSRDMEALAAIRDAAKLLPGNPHVAQHLGLALHRAGDLPEAEAAFRTALADMPTDLARGTVALQLCQVLHDQGRAGAARDMADHAAALLPGDPRPLRWLAAQPCPSPPAVSPDAAALPGA